MIWRYGVLRLGLLAALAGCQAPEMTGAAPPIAATATDADDDPSAEDGGGAIVGDGAGDVGSPLPDVSTFRNPRLGRGGAFH